MTRSQKALPIDLVDVFESLTRAADHIIENPLLSPRGPVIRVVFVPTSSH